MCGIAGFINLRPCAQSRELLGSMISTLRHRGPDGNGIYLSEPAGLAHARLSIIDLAGGAQPMSIAGGSLSITFNGEIFNYLELREELICKGHKFATSSDTEVILHLYQEEGEACVNRLNGQWAFAIWDARRQKLFASRDRIGVRPLFYTKTADRFLFASEIKALFACPQVSRQLDLKALDQIFSFWVTLPSRTAFEGVSQLPPGHSLAVEGDQFRIWQYWKLQYAPESHDSPNDESRLSDELLHLLLDATRLRLRSDVPVGAYLSGGLDSTLITALARTVAGSRLRTFSVSFDDPEYDESSYQNEASAFFGTEHSDVRCAAEDIAADFPLVIRHTEQPVVRTAPVPLFQLARLVRNSGFKVVLTGEGADEMLGGYDIFKEAKIRRFWGRHPESVWRPLLLKRLYPYMPEIQKQPPAYLSNFFHVKPESFASPFFSHLPRWEMTSRLKMFFSPAVKEELRSYNALSELEQTLPASFSSWNDFNRAEYLEATHLLPGYILSSQGDRVAMANSIEGRYPFLDYRVVEFATKLSPNMKMKVLDQKHLLKKAAGDLIPASIRKRHKQPYRAPEGKTFFGPAGSYIHDLLSPARIQEDGIFHAGAVTALLRKFSSGAVSSARDNMALVAILSTQVLIDQLLRQSVVGGTDRNPALAGAA